MPSAPDKKQKTAERALMLYFVGLLFACICLGVLISQRLEIARCGRKISDLHDDAVELRTEQCRLRLEVAERSSYAHLLEKAEEMQLPLIPPEQAIDQQLAERQQR